MKSRGFTLIEILIALVIITGAIAVVSAFGLDIAQFGTQLSSRIEGGIELELTMRVMLTEVRSMGPGENGAYAIATATDTEFSFFTDVDNDGTFEQVRYFLDGTILKKGIIEPEGTEPPTYLPQNEDVTEVAHYIVPGAIFTYYPEGYAPEMTPLPGPIDVSNIRMVTVSATTDQDPLEPPLPATLSINITIRNLRGEI